MIIKSEHVYQKIEGSIYHKTTTYKVTVYWFLFIPVFISRKLIDYKL